MIKKGLIYLYSAWAVLVFFGVLICIFPFAFILIQFGSTKQLAHDLITFWSYLFFFFLGIRINIVRETTLDPAKNYIFVGNHFSYLDVATAQRVIKHRFSFIGKSSVSQIPLLGYLFKQLHIMVDRSAKNSRARALFMGMERVKNGHSVVIFPEGGIKTTDFPNMHQPWADGAFAIALETGVPIVPVTYFDNYKAMPANLLKPHTLRVKIHKPISIETSDSIETLKTRAFNTIQQTLIKDTF